MSDVTSGLPEEVVRIYKAGNLGAQIKKLQSQLEDSRNPQLLHQMGDRRRIAEQIVALQDEMEASGTDYLLRGLSRRAWKKLLAAHPPREGNDGDRAAGFNLETFLDAMTRTCMVDPSLSVEEFDDLQDTITPGDGSRLENAAWALCRNEVSVPFSRAASVILANSDETPE